MSRPTVQTPTIAVGSRLTDYGTLDVTVEGLSTAGGMGLVVWGTNAAAGNRMLALKLLKPERAAAARDAGRRREVDRQFEDEALVWCHLWYHPCVVATYGVTRLPALNSVPVLKLQYAPNGSLRDFFRRARQQNGYLALRAALAWAVHIASALDHIHQPDAVHERPAPLVHCDLKPENVLIDEHGWAQLTDLGLTRAYAALAADVPETEPADGGAVTTAAAGASGLTPHQAEVARLRAILQAAGALPGGQAAPPTPTPAPATLFVTHTLRIPPTRAFPTTSAATLATPSAAIGSRGPVAGSLPYMAPEQWQGLDAAVPATDLYAFGVLLYELFAGSDTPHPFPFDPIPYYLSPDLHAHAQATGYDPLLLAWHAAHTSPTGPAHRLTDPDVAAAALRSGPLAELATRTSADAMLQHLNALILACLAHDPTARPSALTVRDQLAALVIEPCGLEPLQIPEPLAATSRNGLAFWTNLGVTYSMLDREEEAITAKRHAIEYAPTDPNNWLNLGTSLAKLSMQELQRAATAEGGARHEQAVALNNSAQRHYEEALEAYKQAEVHLTPDAIAEIPALPAQIVTGQGVVLSVLGRYGESIPAFQRALVLQPDRPDTRLNLGLDYAYWSQVPDASPAERLARLQAAQREIQTVLAAAPGYDIARSLSERLARALADPAHRFQG